MAQEQLNDKINLTLNDECQHCRFFIIGLKRIFDIQQILLLCANIHET